MERIHVHRQPSSSGCPVLAGSCHYGRCPREKTDWITVSEAAARCVERSCGSPQRERVPVLCVASFIPPVLTWAADRCRSHPGWVFPTYSSLGKHVTDTQKERASQSHPQSRLASRKPYSHKKDKSPWKSETNYQCSKKAPDHSSQSRGRTGAENSRKNHKKLTRVLSHSSDADLNGQNQRYRWAY